MALPTTSRQTASGELERRHRPQGSARHPPRGGGRPRRARSRRPAAGPTDPLPRRLPHQRKVARDGLISFEGRRYQVVGAAVGETVELRLGATEIEVFSISAGELYCRHPRRAERVALPDPVEGSVSLASVLGELPEVEVHRRPLDAYAEAARG
jgi:hypothetical protein